MSSPTLEERVAALEGEIAELRAAVANDGEVKDWRSTIGMFTGAEGMRKP